MDDPFRQRASVPDQQPSSPTDTDLHRQIQALQRSNTTLLRELERACAELAQVQEGAPHTASVPNDFLTTTARELHTLLNATAGYTDQLLILLGMRGDLTPEQREDIERMATSQQHLLALITSILNLAQLDAGHAQYHLASIPIGALLRSIEPMLQPQLAAEGVDYTPEPCDEAITIQADEDKVRQIVLNVLSTAIGRTPRGGTVTIRCLVDAMYAHIVIRDTGGDIAQDQLEQLVEPFLQPDRILSTSSTGGGLRLAISRDLARGMGGDITVQSHINLGATITLTFPRGKMR